MIASAIRQFFLCFVALALLICTTSSHCQSQDKASDTSIQEVIAEGVGSSTDEALKDAFRNAVRQVVGAVVDAETVLKNDEIIDDKVLTYSDGFIKKYDEVSGTKKVAGGLHRIKIKAQVERRSVIAKLKSANITVKKVDGKGMFAELVTQQEGEANADELIRKALSGFPALLTASVVGKPEYDRERGELAIRVDVGVDQEAYKEEVKKLEEVLSKVAINKDSVTLKALPMSVRITESKPDPFVNLFELRDPKMLLSPGVQSNKNQWCLWVCSSTSGNHMNQKWNGYVVPGDPIKAFVPILMPRAGNPGRGVESRSFYDDSKESPQAKDVQNRGRTFLKTYFKNENDSVIAEEERELTVDHNGFVDDARPSRLSLIRSAAVRSMREPFPDYGNYDPAYHLFTGYITPFTFEPWRYGSEFRCYGGAVRSVVFLVKVTPEELKEIADVTCKIEYTQPSK
jgi:hypothetical protein